MYGWSVAALLLLSQHLIGSLFSSHTLLLLDCALSSSADLVHTGYKRTTIAGEFILGRLIHVFSKEKKKIIKFEHHLGVRKLLITNAYSGVRCSGVTIAGD